VRLLLDRRTDPRVKTDGMGNSARKFLQDALVWPEGERRELASEITTSVDRSRDVDGDAAWLAEP
jgi:hypothetical protein